MFNKDKKDAAVEDKIPNIASKFKEVRRTERDLEKKRNNVRMKMAKMSSDEKASAAREVAGYETKLEQVEQQYSRLKALMNEQMDLL